MTETCVHQPGLGVHLTRTDGTDHPHEAVGTAREPGVERVGPTARRPAREVTIGNPNAHAMVVTLSTEVTGGAACAFPGVASGCSGPNGPDQPDERGGQGEQDTTEPTPTGSWVARRRRHSPPGGGAPRRPRQLVVARSPVSGMTSGAWHRAGMRSWSSVVDPIFNVTCARAFPWVTNFFWTDDFTVILWTLLPTRSL